MNTTVEKGISDIVGCLTDPIIVFPGGWGDTIPEWLKTAITMERMIGNMKVLKGEEPTGTDAEACAYLMTLSLTQPMDGDWTEIQEFGIHIKLLATLFLAVFRDLLNYLLGYMGRNLIVV